MMDNNKNKINQPKQSMRKYYILIAVLSLIAIPLVIWLVNYPGRSGMRKETKQPPTATPTPVRVEDVTKAKKGDLGYQEPTHNVKIGTNNVSAGFFDKVEGGEIYIEGSDGVTKLPLAPDEIIIACTNQALASATELDFNQIVENQVVKPSELSGRIPVNEFVVIFASLFKGAMTGHTIAVPVTSCSPQ